MDDLNRAILYLRNVLDSGVFNTSLCDEDVCWGSVQSVNDAIKIMENTKTRIEQLEDEKKALRKFILSMASQIGIIVKKL